MTNYEKLMELYNEIDNLIASRVSSDAPAFTKWYTKAERFLKNQFGEESEERNNFLKTRFTPICFTTNGSRNEFNESCKRGLQKTKEIFSVYLEEMEENTTKTNVKDTEPNDFSKVFIVHGHDGELKEAVARLIEKQGIKTIILNEQTNQGRTIIEKLEGHSNVGGAICLFTPDDVGSKQGGSSKSRARQNVVFEAGYFMGKLGRDKVVIISKGEMELPSDMSGIVYTDKNDWRVETLKELKAVGYKIDLNLL